MTVVDALQQPMQTLTAWLRGRMLEPNLELALEAAFGADSDWFREVSQLVKTGMENGELGGREAGGIRFGRAIKPNPDMLNFSLDVVLMTDVKGPHHSHPLGEIDMVVPLDETARFDGQGEGWKVYGPGSAHHPTVTGGSAIVLYLLPDGAIEFTRG